MHQKTLRKASKIGGIGLHTGKDVRIVLHPAPADHGIVFRIHSGGTTIDVPARAEYVTRTRLGTCLGRNDVQVCTVEHLLAALVGMEIDNVLIEVRGGEIPVMDGSSQPFVSRIRHAGIRIQPAPRRFLRVVKPLTLAENGVSAALMPSAEPVYGCLIDFDHPAVRQQELKVTLTPESFNAEVAKARTFGFEEDIQVLRRQGLALGAGLQNAIGLGQDGCVLNPEGLRYPDEFVRHKILDAIGDLALAGLPLLGEYRGVKSGHTINHKLVQALLANPANWEVVQFTEYPSAEAV